MSNSTDNTSGTARQQVTAGSSRQAGTGNMRSNTAEADAADRNENWSRFIIVSPLKGADNFEEWEISLDLHIQSLGLADILTEDTPTTPANAKQRAPGGGYIGDMAEPYRPYTAESDVIGMEHKDVTRQNDDVIRKEFGFNTGMIEVDLIIELMQSNRVNFASTRAWFTYHQNLWKRINKIETQSDGLWIAATMNL
ncbi:hypothetical protein E4U19_004272 [Claviceps sp. Clav32 group G5]|nr:hypothetical protein E4U19_004272 [Claviceps sp. Clav32 group G5]KAG6043716.1 hypothetical protein E4U39_004234 [Claviceps sp. Clav50 group G5]